MTLKQRISSVFSGIRLSGCLWTIFGSGALAFGLYNIHSVSHVTEGGILGLTLLLEHWFQISPAVSGFICNAVCYLLGWKLLGKNFIIYSIVATLGFSGFYGIFEQFPPLFPQIAEHPLVAAVVGALFVGISCGICVAVGGAPSGDDAMSMVLAKLTGFPIQRIYLCSDLCVLLLSLTYIPVARIAYSLLTVLLSGQLIGLMVRPKIRKIFHPADTPSEEGSAANA